MTSVSVVICTRDQGPRLRLTLRALAVQSVPPREVIVVDDGSTDDTAQVLADARAFLPCELDAIRVPRPRGSAAARNKGAARAEGDLLVFLDSDALVTHDHVKHHVELQSAEGPVVATGPLWHTTTTEYLRDPGTGERFDVAIPPDVQRTIDEDLTSLLIREQDVTERFATVVQRSAAGAYPGLGFMEAEAERLGDAAGHPAAWVLMTPHNVSIPRAEFERAGGFDEQLPFCEGWDLAFRLQSAGIATRRLPTAPTYHLFHFRRLGDFDQQARRWRAIAMIADKHRLRSLLLLHIFFGSRSAGSGLPEEATIQDLDELAALIARYGDSLGPFEVLFRGHPLYAEFEAAR